MTPRPKRPDETDAQYKARVRDVMDALYDGRMQNYIRRARAEGRAYRVVVRRGQDPLDALTEQHPEVAKRLQDDVMQALDEFLETIP